MLEIKKAHELEVVELTKDLPQYGLSKGDQGTVLEVFDQPEEAYLIEFIDDNEKTSKIADWVLPDQIENVDLQGKPFFERGISLLKEGNDLEAAELLRRAVSFWPSYLRLLHNIIGKNFAENRDWEQFIAGMRFLLEIEPAYDTAKRNLAIGFLNYGVKKANEGNLIEALELFTRAFSMEGPREFIELVRENMAAAHVGLGIKSHKEGDFEKTVTHMQAAYMFISDARTRRNLALAYLNIADRDFFEGKHRAAITNYVLAEEAGLLTPEGLNNRAIAHLYSEQVDQAIVALEIGLKLDPGNQITRSNLTLLKANRQALKRELIGSFQTEHYESQYQTMPLMDAVSLSSTAIT
jgi:tetratricopeptide (TPR) repeat protein